MRITGLLLAITALASAWLAQPAAAQIRLPSIKNKLIELALDQISSPGSFEITAGSIEDVDDLTSLLDVKVADGEGVWLTAERLSFAWEPSKLVGGELSITRLEVVGLDVARPPAPGSEPPELKPQQPWSEGLFDWPRAPIAVSVTGFRVERASIAEGVLPQAIRFDAEGRALDRGDVQEVALALRRTDAVRGAIDFSMQRDFAANTVRLRLDASEAAGGMVAAAAGLPADAPARLTLFAEGPPEDWRLVFDAGVERMFAAKGRATLAYAERVTADAEFTLAPGPAMAENVRTVLGAEARIRARVTERADGSYEILEGRLASPALTLEASGVYAAAGDSDLMVNLVALPPLAALAEGVAFERATFEGRVTGPQGGYVAEGAFGLDGLRTAPADAARLRLNGRAAQRVDGADFALTGEAEGLRLDRIAPEAIGRATLAAAGALDGDRLTLAEARLQSPAVDLSAEGGYDMAAQAGEIDVTLAAPEIAPFAGPYGAAASGAASAAATVRLAGEEVAAEFTAGLENFRMDPIAARRLALGGTVEQAAGRIGFDLSGDGAGLVLDKIPPGLTREATFAARGALEGGALTLEAANLASPLVSAEAAGSVDLEGGALAVDYAVTTTELAPVARAYGADAAGELAARGRAEGALAAPRLAGSATLADAAFDGREYGAVSLTHDVTLGAAPAGEIALAMRGSWLGDADAETRFRLEERSLTLDGLAASAFGAAVAGDAVVDLDGPLADGALSVSVPDLSTLSALAGTDLAGRAEGRLTLTVEDGKQDVLAALDLRGLAAAGATVARADAQLDLRDALGAREIALALDAREVATGGVTLASLKAEVDGPFAALTFAATASGMAGDKPLTAALAGIADASGEVAVVSLARAEAALGEDAIRLRRPLEIRAGAGTIEAPGIDLALPEGGALTGDFGRRPDGMTGDMTLSALQVSLLNRLAGVPATTGRIDARATFDTRAESAGANVTAQARGVGFEGAEAIEGLDLDAAARWNGRRLDADATIAGGFGDPLRGRLALPLFTGEDGVPFVPQGGSIDGALTWRGRLGDLWALVPAPGHLLDGEADIDLRVAGSLDKPQVSGRVDLSNGEYQNLDVGTILTGLTLRTEVASQDRINLTLEASDGAEGRITARTALILGRTPSVDMAATIARATLVRRDDVTAEISGDLSLAGPFTDLALKGDLTVDRAEVRLVSAAPPEVVELEGVRIKGAPEDDGNGNGESVLSLDLRVHAERNIFVRGRGLDSEWRMDVRARGDAAQPVVTGVIERVRGRLELLGKPFELARGSVTFDGGRKIDPQIDVAVERETPEGLRGGIYVGGRASQPELSFASIPPLPEDEVMPRLLFGQSRQSLTGAQAIQLATGLATLLGGGPGPLDNLRAAAGLDVLRVTGSTPEDAAVTVGRNIGENIFVGARQKLGGEGSSIAVEVEVFDGLVVDSEIGQTQGSNIGLTWRKDF